MIDRADYMIFQDDEEKLEAYEDHAWRKGTLHLSAPCIYTRVIEALKFEKGRYLEFVIVLCDCHGLNGLKVIHTQFMV